jgi:hypothetical protein
MNTLTANVYPAHARPIDRCKDTGRVRIGIAHVAKQAHGGDSLSRDALRIQAALLDPRTAQPQNALQRLLGAAWKWL